MWQHVQARVLDDDLSDVIVNYHASDDSYDIHVIYDIVCNYLLWKQVQNRVLEDDHSNAVLDHYACDNDYDIHVIHDTACNNNDLVFTDDDDHNNAIVNHHASDSDHDIHVNNNIHMKNNDDVIYDNITYNNPFKYSTCININLNLSINIITCESNNYDEENNNHVDIYDVGLVQGDDLVANDYEENNDATSSVPCVLSSSKPTSIVYDYDTVNVNDHYMIQCDDTSVKHCK